MIRFEMDVSAADLASRTIEGTMVPYGEIGRIAGTNYRFRPGSVRLARSRTPLLVDHDRREPVGVLAELVQRDEAVLARFAVDQTPAGDLALVQAASGSRGALSVGAELDDVLEADGVVDVVAARIFEVSLTALGAFNSANVTRVAAEADEPEPVPDSGTNADEETAPDPDPTQTELPVEPEPEPTEEEETMTANAAPDVVLASRSPAPRELNAGELVGFIIRAQHGDKEAGRYLEAVLAETISTDVTGLLPPQYERTVLGGKEIPRTLYNIFRSRPLPGVGLAVNKPKWTTRPDGAWAATVDADATSNKVVIGSQAANVERWDWAGAISWVVVQRSDPSIVDEIYGEAVEDFYSDVEEKIAAELSAALVNAASTIGAGIAAFFDENDRTPDVIIVAPDVWGEMADGKQLDAPVGGAGVSTATGLTSTFAGIPIGASGKLAAGTRYLATRRAIDARVTEPVRLTANAIGALNVELAVVGEALFDTDWPDEVMALTPAV